MASKIEDYGIIGDTQTVALVSKAGSIDWLCVPRFDSDACFAALVGYDEHGRWAIRPMTAIRETWQAYDGDTLILVTEFTCDGGKVRLTDFMPPSGERSDIIRQLEGVEGEVSLEMVLEPRFGYGANRPFIRRDANDVTFTVGPDTLLLRASIPVQTSDERASAYFTVRAGERVELQLAWYASHRPAPKPLDVAAERARTAALWSSWAKRCTYQGQYREAVVRSLLTLKALTYAPTGAIVAAPTAGLPEELGGVRNWDYRFCWVRDASLTLHALMAGGYIDEASAFRDWLVRATAGDPTETQIMYDIDGGRRLTEMSLDWLPGYEGSRPVRIGNAAAEQFQLDIYGEVLSAIYLARRLGLKEAASDVWRPARALIEHIERVWQRPDDGVWEVRGGRRHFTHSKIMAWVAVDRAVRLIEEFGVGGDEGREMVPGLSSLRERIHEEVCERGYNPRMGAFTQFYGGDGLDASVLLMPHVGFLSAKDERVQGTVAAVERHLLRDGFVLRYSTDEAQVDGLPGTEGAFLACSFWLADNYAFAGRIDEATALYDRLLGLRNHLGLLAEEFEPRIQRQVGNFPQGFSHLALVTTARILESEDAQRKGFEPALPEPESRVLAAH
jgi:GH15 family glucan-1,4-alpha-glucosidase